MAPDCGNHSLCGSEVPGVPGDFFGSANRGECGPCTGNFITLSGSYDVCAFDCGSVCGAHGSWEGDIVAAQAAGTCGDGCFDSTCGHACRCFDGYVTGNYQDLPCQLAPTYVVSGALAIAYNGRYERLEKHTCGSAPVYQLGGEGGSVLYRHNGVYGSDWLVGSSERIVDCSYNDGVIFSSRGLSAESCHFSPDMAGCAGKWLEKVDGTLVSAPNLNVTIG